MTTICGLDNGKNARIGIVISQFNEHITKRLLDACMEELKKLGVDEKNIILVQVPGAFEIPVAAQQLAQKKSIDAVICLGAVIRGETMHYELIANEISRGMGTIALLTAKPVIFEVLTTDTMKLAEDRAQIKGYNKGQEAAKTAVQMVSVMKQLKEIKS